MSVFAIDDLRTLAHRLGGEIDRNQVRAPGPGHSSRDRSMWVRPCPAAPDGFICGSFSGDDWQTCKDHVKRLLGMPRFDMSDKLQSSAVQSNPIYLRQSREVVRRTWLQAYDPRQTVVETYLKSRGLELPDEIAGSVLRFHSACPWREGDEIIRVPAMVAALRSIDSDELIGVHRTRLTADGQKIGRRMLGRAASTAVKLDADDAVTMGLAIGEGIETCLAARQLGFRSTWALGSCVAISNFPVLAGVEALTLLAERDEASARAVQQCARRWYSAGREVIIVNSLVGSDVNDALQRRRHG